jgi:tRNA(adenine34) deaminase
VILRVIGTRRTRLVCAVFWAVMCAAPKQPAAQMTGTPPDEMTQLEAELTAIASHPKNPDDPFVIESLREAIAGVRDGSGGVGACLVRAATGEIVERGHNRQFSPHFRSDLHAEMDLLDRFEERVRTMKPSADKPGNPRAMYDGLVLYTSYEPCPMCTARILNTGLTRIVYASPDPTGGMTSRIAGFPPFWRDLAKGKAFVQAQCIDRLTEMAQVLFGPYTKRGYSGPPADADKP